jgi:3-hydroxybutyryl-CoA dehydrogenase
METNDIRKVSVIGAGLMGHGIAQESAVAGYQVHVHDVDGERLTTAKKNIRNNLQMLTAIGLVTPEQAEAAPSNLRFSTALNEVVIEADIVIEAASEDLRLKRELFQSLDKLCPQHTILASNTSSLLPGKLATATQRPDKVLVAHYFNPPYLLPLVEIVRGEKTSDETVNVVHGLLKKLGKTPVIVRKEIPGFIGNRLQTALFREALSLVEKGIATAEDVDIVIKNGFGRRLAAAGVFEIWEIAGWDLILAVAENLVPEIENSTEVSPLLKEKVARGELGTKVGKGFYEWTPETIGALKERIAHTLVAIASNRQGA